MGKKLSYVIVCVAIINLFFTTRQENFTQSFEKFCVAQGFSHLLTESFIKEINEKKSFVELKKNCQLVQFTKVTTNEDEDIFLFSNFVTSNCGLIPTVNTGCYTYNNNEWTDVTKKVMPQISFLEFYGDDQKPPKGYENIGTYRYELHKNGDVKLVLEQNWSNDDPKKERIFNQVKYSAIDLKWNKADGNFTIKKWLR